MSSIDKMRKKQRQMGNDAVQTPLAEALDVLLGPLPASPVASEASKAPALTPKSPKRQKRPHGLPDGFTWPEAL